MTMIPATILTGFLGAGKTTLLRRILTEAHGQKIAVIENEFGEENIDTDILISDTQEHIVQMNNGCVCCTIREDLRTALTQLAEKRAKGELQFDRVIIETTGLADPGPVAQTFFIDDTIAEQYLLDSIITLVDAKHAEKQLTDRQEARKQVGFADQIFISKSDLVDQQTLQTLTNRLKSMNPRAQIQAVNFGNVSLDKILDLRGFNLNEHLSIDETFNETPQKHEHKHDASCVHDHGKCEHEHEHGESCAHPHHHHYDDDVKSFVFKSERAFDPAKLEDFLGAVVNVYGPHMLRYKGVLLMKDTDRKVIFQGVHQLMGSDLGPLWASSEKKENKMVFIGINLPKDIFLQGLEQCLV